MAFSAIETSHSRKHQDRWLGPMVMVRRTQGGSYILETNQWCQALRQQEKEEEGKETNDEGESEQSEWRSGLAFLCH
jgi:hypothetical protein